MLRSLVLASLLFLGLEVSLGLGVAGCVSTTPCRPGTVEDPMLGCVEPDGGVTPDGGVDTGEDAELPDAELLDAGFDAGCATSTFYADMDGDESGDPTVSMEACTAPTGYVASSDDCDDTTELRHGGLAEVCDGLDNDCVGAADDTFACVQNTMTSCTTSCGSTGMGSCTAACAAPAAADCTPPTETCNTVDDDCDGLIDEGLQTVGPELNLGTTTGRAVTVATTDGFVVFMNRGTGIFARRFDSTGAIVGSDVTVTTTATNDFDAWWTGAELFVAWHVGVDLLGSVYTPDLATASPSAARLATVSEFISTVRVAASSAGALIAHQDSAQELRIYRCGFPALGGCALLARTAGGYTIDGGEMELSADATRAYLAYRGTPTGVTNYRIRVGAVRFSGTSDGNLVELGTGLNPYFPVPHFFTAPDGGGRLAVVWGEDPTATANDRLRMAVYDVTGGVLSVRDTQTLVPFFPPPTAASPYEPFALTASGARWFASYLTVSGATTTSTWRVVEITQPLVGALTSRTLPLDIIATRENRSVSIAPGAGASVFVSASRTDGTGRGYLIGCP